MGCVSTEKEVGGESKQSPKLPSSPLSQGLGIPKETPAGKLGYRKGALPGGAGCWARVHSCWGEAEEGEGRAGHTTCIAAIVMCNSYMFTSPFLVQPGPQCQVPVLFLVLALHKSTCPGASSSFCSSHTTLIHALPSTLPSPARHYAGKWGLQTQKVT